MQSVNLHILTPNKDAKRYFGVDYFMHLLNGNDPMFKYYATPLDHNPVFHEGPIACLPEMYEFLEMELSTKPAGSIVGIQMNPDIYDGIDSLERVLKLLHTYQMGLYLETASEKILKDIERLLAFAKERPLLIAVPAASDRVESRLFGERHMFDHAQRLLGRLKSAGLKAGLIIKPIIPFLNDDVEDFSNLVKRAVALHVDFIYPSFSIKFDSRKIKAFYDIIDLEHPEWMIRYKDLYGMKHVWESPKVPELKKAFVIICRKNKIDYAMKDIINLYKPDLNIQLKLF